MLWVTMYVTLTGIQNGEPVYLASVPGTACGGLEIALCELTYYHRWLNIGAALGNNQVSTGQSTLKIPDELDDVLQPLGTELRLHAPTGQLELSAERRLVINHRLADLLGFSRNTFEPGKTLTADKPHQLAVHREVCVHLAEISTLENLHNARPSTLLGSVPVENERCRGSRTETFPALQYKQLASGTVSQLTLTVLDIDDKRLDFDHLSAVLHIRNIWRGWPWEHQKMPRAGFSRSGGYRRIREGWGRGTAVWPQAVRRSVQTKKGRHPRGRWGAEALPAEQCR